MSTSESKNVAGGSQYSEGLFVYRKGEWSSPAPLEFHFVNYYEDGWTNSLKEFLAYIIKKEGGVVIEDYLEMINGKHKDVFVINIGTVNHVSDLIKETLVMTKHRSDIYAPSLIVSAIRERKFNPLDVDKHKLAENQNGKLDKSIFGRCSEIYNQTCVKQIDGTSQTPTFETMETLEAESKAQSLVKQEDNENNFLGRKEDDEHITTANTSFSSNAAEEANIMPNFDEDKSMLQPQDILLGEEHSKSMRIADTLQHILEAQAMNGNDGLTLNDLLEIGLKDKDIKKQMEEENKGKTYNKQCEIKKRFSKYVHRHGDKIIADNQRFGITFRELIKKEMKNQVLGTVAIGQGNMAEKP